MSIETGVKIVVNRVASWEGGSVVSRVLRPIASNVGHFASFGFLPNLGIPDPSNVMTPTLIGKAAVLGVGALSYVYALVAAILFALFLLFNVSKIISLGGRSGVGALGASLASPFLRVHAAFATRRQWARRAGAPRSMHRLAAILAVEAILLPFEFAMLFVEGSVRAVGYCFAVLPLIFWLLLFTYVGLAVEADPAGWFDLLDGSTKLVQDGYNVAAHAANTISAFAVALFLAPYNATMKLGFSLITLIVGETGLILGPIVGGANAEFTSSAQEFADVTSGVDFKGGGRRILRGVLAVDKGTNDAAAIVSVIQSYSVFVAQIFDLVGDLFVIILKVLFEVLGGAIGAVLKTIAPLFQIFACATTNIPCALLQALNYALQSIGTVINDVILHFIDVIIAIIPGVPPLKPIKLPDIGCAANALSGVACACSSFFGNMPACGEPSYSCTQQTDGQWAEMTTATDGSVTSGPPGRDAVNACPNTRRMLSAYGHMLNMHDAGDGLACHTACINDTTLLRACPAEAGRHVLTYDGHCDNEIGVQGQNRRARRALLSGGGGGGSASTVPFDSVSDYIHTVFNGASSGGSSSVRITNGENRDARVAAKAAKAKAKGAAAASESDGGSSGVLTRAQVNAGVREAFTQFKSQLPPHCAAMASTSSSIGVDERGGGGNNNNNNEDAFSRHADLGCMMHASAAKSRKSRSTHIGTAASAWAEKMKGSYTSSSSSSRSGRRLLVQLASSLSVRATQITALSGLNAADALFFGGISGGTTQSESSREALASSTVEHIFAVVRREMAEVRIAVARNGDGVARRDLGNAKAAVTSGNVFESKTKTKCAHVLCPGTVFNCVMHFKSCPRPNTWTPRIAVDYAILNVAAQMDSLDERVILSDALSCWNSYATNPRTNPFSASLVGTDILTNKHLKWCAPMVGPFNVRLPHITIDFRTMMNEACADGACACPAYYTGDFDTHNWWFAGVHFFVLSRLHNGAVAAQWFLADLVTKDTWVDTTWQFALRPLGAPLWLVTLWGDQGMPGSRQTQLLCAWLHSASITYAFLLLIPVGILYVSYKKCIEWTAKQALAIVLLPVRFLIDGSLRDHHHDDDDDGGNGENGEN